MSSVGTGWGAVNMALSGSRLHALLPRYDFNERHARVIGREPRVVYDAFKALTLREMPISRLLFAVRSLPARLAGQPGLSSQLDVPLLDQFLDRGFVLLADAPGEELAAGVIGQMWRRGGRMVIPGDREEFVTFAEPGFVKAALTFRFIGRGDGTTLVETETRVAATDQAARRGFGRYWLLIRGFSGLIRRDWLRAVARRAERGERAAEIADRTMHGVLHLGWVPDGTGGYRGQLAVIVKPNGLLRTAYLAAIRPFRHRIVCPAMLQAIGRTWRTGARSASQVRRPDVRPPPGQHLIGGFPRFGTHLARPAPAVPIDPVIEISGAGAQPFTLPLAALATLPRRELTADLHCVAGWSVTNLHWEGVAFETFYRMIIDPAVPPDTSVTHVAFGGLDGYRSVVSIEDALAGDLLIAERLDGRRLDGDHGAPARLVSPRQYGYVSTKHLCRIELHTAEPTDVYASPALRLLKPHPRARVWEEERHRHLPAWSVRRVYRLLIAPIALLSARGSGRRRTTPASP